MHNCSFIWERRIKLNIIVGLVCALLTAVGFAQQLQAPNLPSGLPSALPSAPLPATTPVASSTEDDRTNAKNSSSGISVSQNSNGTLTASQIITIVQAR